MSILLDSVDGPPVTEPAAAAGRSFSPQALRDFALVARLVAYGDEKDYTLLFKQYQRPVYHLLYRLVPQAEVAEDLTMEVLARVCQRLPKFQPVYAFSTWLFWLATNYGIDYLRRRLPTVSLHREVPARERAGSLWHLPDAAPAPDAVLWQAQRHAHLHQIADQLPSRYRRLVELHYFEELSYGEITVRQQLPLGTVKAQLHHCRKLLAQRLASSWASP